MDCVFLYSFLRHGVVLVSYRKLYNYEGLIHILTGEVLNVTENILIHSIVISLNN